MPPTSDFIDADLRRLLGEMLGDGRNGSEKEGEWMGPYRLCQRLGEGGFGAVWRAEQIEPVRREVAVKVIKLGMDTMQVLNRFQQERQTLASLDHPGIATMLDAGMSPDGRPYFAMELIQGEPITQWCEARALPVPDRLRIFEQVCHAVHHAHQKGIIHRDLKPNNILVTNGVSGPAPKVIDFGIAKVVHASGLSDRTLLTRGDQMLGTPDYMSPEQSEGSAAIDIRSDIYSLGVVLYELLTGVLPFESSANALMGVPQRPSTRKRKLTKGSVHHAPAAATLAGAFRKSSSDLDWITLCALERDCDRRYQSAAELAADLKRFLNHQPLLVRPPSFGYVTSRWVKRHRVAFAAACAVTLSMVGGTGVALWQAKAARRAQHVAESEAVRAHEAEQAADRARLQAEKAHQQSQQTADFVTGLLDRVGAQIENGRNPEALKAALATSDEEILKLSTDPELRIELLDRIENIYDTIGEAKLAIPLAQTKAREIGRLHGVDSEVARAAELASIKLVINFGARATGPALLETLKRRVEATGERGSRFWLEVQRQVIRVWIKLDMPDKALGAADELMAEARVQKLGNLPLVTNQIAHAAALEFAGDYAQALAVLEEARRSATAKHMDEIERREIYLFERKKDYKKGAERLRAAVAKLQAEKGDRTAELVPLLLQLGGFESRDGDHAAAIATCERALGIAGAHAPVDEKGARLPTRDVWQALLDLAGCESAVGRHGEAINHAREALKLATSLDNNKFIIRSLRDLADFHRDAGDLEQAYDFKRQNYERIRAFGANLRDSEQELREMCDIRLEQKRPEQAMQLGFNLWADLQSRPESKQDTAHVGQVAETIVNCFNALKAAKPETPEPRDLMVWKRAVEEGKRFGALHK